MIVASCQLSRAMLSTYSAVGGAITGGAGEPATGANG